MTKALTITSAITAFIVGSLFIGYLMSVQLAHGSTLVGNDYIATSTAASGAYGATITGSKLIRTGAGSLAQYVITGANTGVINFYNATTSDITKRAPNLSTSTILIASFPASAAANTYTFDAQFTTGLYIDVISGNMPTGTIMYRAN